MGFLDYFKQKKEQEQKQNSVFDSPTIYINGEKQESSKPANPLSVPAIYRGIDTIAASVAGLPVDVYERGGDNGREKRPDHPWADALKYKPNNYINSNEFWRSAIAQRYLAGNCYIHIDRIYYQLSFLPTDRTKPLIYLGDDPAFYGRKYFVVEPEKDKDGKPIGQYEIFDAGDVIHLHTLPHDPDAGMGMPLNELFNLQIGVAVELERYTTCLLNSGGLQRGYLSTEGTVSPTNAGELSRQFSTIYDSTNKRRVRIPVVNNGTKFTPLNFTSHDLQLDQKKKGILTDIANILGIQLHLINSLEKANYNSLEAQGRDYLSKTIQPLLNEIVAEVNTKLFSREDRRRFYVEHNAKQLLQIDAQTEASVYDTMHKGGAINVNEWRAGLNLPAVEGGESYLVPLNMADAQQVQQLKAIELEQKALELEKQRAELNAQQQAKQTEADQAQQQAQAEAQAAASEADGARVVNSFEGIAARYSRLIEAAYKAQDKADAGAEGLDQGRAADALRPILEALAADVAAVFPSYSPSKNYQALADAYAGGQSIRFSNGQRSASYETNRAINAHARIVYSETGVEVRWIGGELDGVTRPVAVPFRDKSDEQPYAVFHPPIQYREGDSYGNWIVPNQSLKKIKESNPEGDNK